MDEMRKVIPPLIENTTMQLRVVDDVPRSYWITPVSGYVLHDRANDWPDIDPDTMEEVHMPGYVSGTVTCGANYDFTANPRAFYAVPENSVPADPIICEAGGIEA